MITYIKFPKTFLEDWPRNNHILLVFLFAIHLPSASSIFLLSFTLSRIDVMSDSTFTKCFIDTVCLEN